MLSSEAVCDDTMLDEMAKAAMLEIPDAHLTHLLDTMQFQRVLSTAAYHLRNGNEPQAQWWLDEVKLAYDRLASAYLDERTPDASL